MQIIASILAEMFASGELIDQSKYADVAADAAAMRRLDGPRLVEGVAIGRAWLHEPRVEVTRLLAENPQVELERLERAIGELRESLDQMLATSDLVRRRAARGARGLPHVRPRHRLAAPHPRGDRHRPVGRGRGAPGAGGDPRPHRACQRSLPARAADRPRRHRQPAAAPPGRQGAEPRSGRPARGHDPGGAQPRRRGPARVRPPQAARRGPRGGLARPRTSPSSPAPSASPWSAGSRVPWPRSTPAIPVALDGDNGHVFVRPNDEILQAFHNADARARRAAAATSTRSAACRRSPRTASRSRCRSMPPS